MNRNSLDLLNIPPGLERRNKYGNYVSTVNKVRNFRRQLNEVRQHFRRETRFHSVVTTHLDQEYENLLLLRDVITGLKVKDLLSNSKIKLNECETEYCSICFDRLKPLDIIRELNCEHSFHINCIEQWLSMNTRCPLCRKDLSLE